MALFLHSENFKEDTISATIGRHQYEIFSNFSIWQKGEWDCMHPVQILYDMFCIKIDIKQICKQESALRPTD